MPASSGDAVSTPEAEARKNIDRRLEAAGWAVREFPLSTGEVDYMLFVDGRAAGVLEAKPVGHTLMGVTTQSEKYQAGTHPALQNTWGSPFPFAYESTGVETQFRDERDPHPRSRVVFSFHKPETLKEWLEQADTLRSRIRNLPPLEKAGLWNVQVEAIEGLEASLTDDRPRSLIQMATGSGKTYTMVTEAYRLIKYGGAKRVLFLVDRRTLGRQAYGEFDQYITPDDEGQILSFIDPAVKQSLLKTRREHLEAAFETVDQRYGSVDTYLCDGLGLNENILEKLHTSLLE